MITAEVPGSGDSACSHMGSNGALDHYMVGEQESINESDCNSAAQEPDLPDKRDCRRGSPNLFRHLDTHKCLFLITDLFPHPTPTPFSVPSTKEMFPHVEAKPPNQSQVFRKPREAFRPPGAQKAEPSPGSQ